MANTSSRTLRLLSLLQARRYWPGTDLADRLGVSVRTLRRDVDRLRELGYPVQASRGVAGGYQLASGAALPPLLLDDEEAVAIGVALRTAASGSVAGMEETSVRALAKVVHVLPKRLRRRVDALRDFAVAGQPPGPTVDAAALSVLVQACRDADRLRFGYTRGDGTTAQRLVEPHQLVSIGRRWYLVAWDLNRHDWRSFRVDRLTGPTALGIPFRPRELPGGDPVAFVRAGIARLPGRYEIDVLVYADRERVAAEVAQWGRVEPVDDDHCRLRMSVDDLSWPAMMLGAIGADFEVVEPPELAEYVREWGRRFTRATE